MSARRISFVNFKGGVGKTSLTVNLAACLAAEYQQKVLLVDCDAQSNSSIWLMGANRWNAINESPEKTIYSVFIDQNIAQPMHLNIIKSVIRDGDDMALLPTLDLLPATYALMDLEHEYQDVGGYPYFLKFNLQLSQFFSSYDYILFDCPPNVYRATKCALFSSEEIYIPCNPDILSFVGLTLLGQKVGQFQQESTPFQAMAQDYRHAQIRGIILNGLKGPAKYDDILDKMKAKIYGMRTQSATASDAEILPRRIPHSVTVGKTATEHLPVILTDGNSQMKQAYTELAAYIHQKPPQQMIHKLSTFNQNGNRRKNNK
ncbi:MAG: ParA family protein [Pyrinomonadaceae bacterium]|nr:ParA family protein [Pyrinomonadaceae bacterium]